MLDNIINNPGYPRTYTFALISKPEALLARNWKSNGFTATTLNGARGIRTIPVWGQS